MEKFRTVNQLMNQLKEDNYKFLYANNEEHTYTYWDDHGRIALVNLQEKTIQYKGDGTNEIIKR